MAEGVQRSGDLAAHGSQRKDNERRGVLQHAVATWQRAALQRKCTLCRMQRATPITHCAVCTGGTYIARRAMRSTHRATCNMKHATSDVQHGTYNVPAHHCNP